MFQMKRVLLAALLVAVAVPTATADEPKVKKPEQPGAEPAKPIIIQLDASKLPPELLKELLKLSKQTEPTKPSKPELLKPDIKPEKPIVKPETKPVKTISLSDAIAIAEKTTQGTATKAERKEEDGTVQFKVDVLDGKGNKSKLTIDAGGKVTGTEKKQEEEKGKGKKKKDD